jgi:hypothetical protein
LNKKQEARGWVEKGERPDEKNRGLATAEVLASRVEDGIWLEADDASKP